MKRRTLLRCSVAAGVLLVGLGVTFAIQQFHGQSKVVPTTRVQKGTLQLDVDASGELRTSHSLMLVAPQVNGTLQIIHLVPTGARVKAGDVVVEFDPSEQQYNLAQSLSQLNEAGQEIVKARADAAVKTAENKVALLKAKFDVRRAELDVSRNELVSEIEAKKNLLNLEAARRRLAQLEQDVNSRVASDTATVALLEEKRQTALLGMQQAQHSIDGMKVRSTIEGVVSIRGNLETGMVMYGVSVPEYREGDLASPGRLLAEVSDLNQMEVVAQIPESDRSNLSTGQSAEIRLDAQPDAVIPAQIRSISGMASREMFGPNAIGRFDVHFSLLKNAGHFDLHLHPGTSAQILVRGSQVKGQLYLPSQCLFEKDGKLVVYVKHGSAFEPAAIKIKFRTENHVALESLPEGTEVALVNPEEFLKKQAKNPVASPVGVGQ